MNFKVLQAPDHPPKVPAIRRILHTLVGLKKDYRPWTCFFPNVRFLIHLGEILENPVDHRVVICAKTGERLISYLCDVVLDLPS